MTTPRTYGAGAVPDGWRWVRLGELFKLEYGVSLPERDRTPGEMPVIGSAGVVGSHNKAAVVGPGIVVGRKGSIGTVTWVDHDFVPIDTTYVAVPTEDKADLRWTYHLLSNENLSKMNRATGVPGLNRNDVYAMRRAVPPLAEQRTIAAVLDSIDEAIGRTEEVIAATEDLRDSLLHELLTRGVPGWHTQWNEVPGIGTIPADWQVVRLGDLLELDQPGAWGQEPYDDGAVPVLRATNLTKDGRIDPTRIVRRQLNDRDLANRQMVSGDILLERSGGGPGAPVGRVALIGGLAPIYCSNFCQQLRFDTSRTYQPFMFRFLWRLYCLGFTSRLEHRTTGIRNLDYSAYLSLPVYLPTISEQMTIAAWLDAADESVEQVRAVLSKRIDVKFSVADTLLTGHGRVIDPEEVLG